MTAAAGRYRYLVLALLVFIYTINCVDRIMLGILVPSIEAELGLTDTQLGLPRGTAFALFFTALGIFSFGIPIASALGLVIGAISDELSTRYGAESLRYAILAGTVFHLLGAALFALTARRLDRDWV